MKNSTYIDLFAGCGGLSLGLYNSGKWKGLFAIEKNIDAFKTLKHNLIDKKSHFDWPKWLPIENHDINTIIKEYPNELNKLRGEIDLVAGGPPCQGFSTAGKRVENDTRNRLIGSYIKFIRLVQPKVIFFENVKGFTQQFDKNKVRGRNYSDYVMRELKKSSQINDFKGYDVYGELVDFSKFGIPQKRTRFILIGIRKDIQSKKRLSDFFSLIRKSSEDILSSKGLKNEVTLQEAISDLTNTKKIPSLESKGFLAGVYGNCESPFQKLMRGNLELKAPDSHRFANHRPDTIDKFNYILQNAEKNKSLSREMKEKFKLKKRTVIPLDGNSPTPTLTTLPDDYIHYSEPRIFTVREYARIQSFNDWYEFKGKYTTGGKLRTKEVPRYSQIGNAIPPLFGEQAGLTISKLING